MDRPLTIVIPVYNEGANFPQLWAEIVQNLSFPFTALVAYDFDGDDTLPAVGKIVSQGETRLRLVKNSYGRGVVGAIRTGFDAAPDGPVLILMADLSDDLAQVPKMLDLYARGSDVVVGSRYMKGGRLIGGPWFKQSLSRLSGLTLCWFRGLPTHDATNAFKIYDRAMLQAIPIESKGGFELSLELTVKAFLAGYTISETPSTWRDRTAGQSRFRLWKWLPHYLKWYFMAFRPRSSNRPPARELRET
ncbi:MAG TPA: glycosyltransferase [Acidobacteriaceae bacterium]|jgi:glycosyltransferase involved in cell wall biosynthesis|nr:glycosyltransferase [Acidobacteriaceae bacterium]